MATEKPVRHQVRYHHAYRKCLLKGGHSRVIMAWIPAILAVSGSRIVLDKPVSVAGRWLIREVYNRLKDSRDLGDNPDDYIEFIT